ncbi:coiled-coil and C2 domain-containing protein 1-like isoform X2 [Contarinia nasturtii]|uniref:coiled-coil and C2 domain-containing protein 1-like isoform X2 n=1 Tax=Contarinia nasturtii TaxID=265458 RepID=UPI0012D3B2BC|nr:coiled-coil and C2 domain-containing protein 1-like isoform X2 [Contarinia nasturtii]
MFNRNKKQSEPKRKHDLSQFGIFDVPDLENPDDDDSGGDSDLEAELAAITAGDKKVKPKPKPKVIPQSDLDKMVAESLRDIGSDEELSGDDDDPDLLNELSEITGNEDIEPETTPTEPSAPIQPVPIEPAPKLDEPILPTTTVSTVELLKSRIEMYKLSEKVSKESGDSTKARSRARGIKTLESMLKQALAGKTINPDDIPPVVSIKAPNAPSAPVDTNQQPSTEAQPESEPQKTESDSPKTIQNPQSSTVNESKINALLERQGEYKKAALASKRSGDTAMALQYVKIIKIFDTVLVSARNGEEVDLSDMPPHPSELSLDQLKVVDEVPTLPPAKEENTVQQSSDEKNDNEKSDEPAAPKPKAVELPPPEAPKTILEALTQRLQKYQANETNAKAEGNDRKARQNGRIAKQYQDAIRAHKAGKPVEFDELPAPPGYPPIPVNTTQAPPSRPAPKPPAPVPSGAPQSGEPSTENTSSKRSPMKRQDSRTSGNHSNTSVMNKTIEILLDRQKDFKEAALEAKKAGELEQAKELLKTFKGIENLLNVARGGLPVDLSSLPISPKQREKLNDTFEMLSDTEENAAISDDLKSVYEHLEKQLTKQFDKCKAWSVHHRNLGDVAGTNRFENLAVTVQHDLDIVKLAHRKGGRVPKFRFEQKSFNIVKCNTDLAETELEIQVVRGISYNVSRPKDVDTYVKVEFPYPQETPYRNKTAVIYDTDSPEYNEKFVAEIQPKVRLCQRVFKRHGIKFEVYIKGGFLRSDTLIGTANVKLQPLETSCEIHESFDLMDGRKTVGGKLEVKIRVRNPILSKQVVNESEKWLVLE